MKEESCLGNEKRGDYFLNVMNRRARIGKKEESCLGNGKRGDFFLNLLNQRARIGKKEESRSGKKGVRTPSFQFSGVKYLSVNRKWGRTQQLIRRGVWGLKRRCTVMRETGGSERCDPGPL